MWDLGGLLEPGYATTNYFVPWARYFPYLFGIILGYLYVKDYFTPLKNLKKEKEGNDIRVYIDMFLNTRLKRVGVSLFGGLILFLIVYGLREY